MSPSGHAPPPARLALVGDRSRTVTAHTRLPAVLKAVRAWEALDLDAYWISTDEVEAGALSGFDGIWLVPGSPYRSESGALNAIRIAREQAIPFLGTCAGFQHAMLEYARHVCGLGDVQHAENNPAGEEFLIQPLSCSLVGHEGTVLTTPGSLAARALGSDRSIERYHCSYGLAADYLDALSRHGMRFSGHDADGAVRIAELDDHPFYLATLFQPELADQDSRVHPILAAFAAAVVEHAARVVGSST